MTENRRQMTYVNFSLQKKFYACDLYLKLVLLPSAPFSQLFVLCLLSSDKKSDRAISTRSVFFISPCRSMDPSKVQICCP